MKILLVNPDPNTITLIQSGTVNVGINVTTNVTTYSLYKFAVNDLEIYYLTIEPWLITLGDDVTDPIIQYNLFNPVISTCQNNMLSKFGGQKLLLNVQANKFGSNMLWKSWQQYCGGNIDIYGEGILLMGEIGQNERLTIIIN